MRSAWHKIIPLLLCFGVMLMASTGTTGKCSETDARLASTVNEDQVSNSTDTFLRLIHDLIDRGRITSNEIAQVTEREMPINPVFLAEGLTAAERHANGKVFDRLLKSNNLDWNRIRSDIHGWAKKTEDGEKRREEVKTDTANMFFPVKEYTFPPNMTVRNVDRSTPYHLEDIVEIDGIKYLAYATQSSGGNGIGMIPLSSNGKVQQVMLKDGARFMTTFLINGKPYVVYCSNSTQSAIEVKSLGVGTAKAEAAVLNGIPLYRVSGGTAFHTNAGPGVAILGLPDVDSSPSIVILPPEKGRGTPEVIRLPTHHQSEGIAFRAFGVGGDKEPVLAVFQNRGATQTELLHLIYPGNAKKNQSIEMPWAPLAPSNFYQSAPQFFKKENEGRFIFTFHSGVRIINTEGKLIKEIPIEDAQQSFPVSVVSSPSGNLAAVAREYSVAVIDLNTNKILHNIDTRFLVTAPPQAFSLDGRSLLTWATEDGNVWIADPQTGEIIVRNQVGSGNSTLVYPYADGNTVKAIVLEADKPPIRIQLYGPMAGKSR